MGGERRAERQPMGAACSGSSGPWSGRSSSTRASGCWGAEVWCSGCTATRPSPFSRTWIGWAPRYRIAALNDLERRIVKHAMPRSLAAIEHGPTNGRLEPVNTKACA